MCPSFVHPPTYLLSLSTGFIYIPLGWIAWASECPILGYGKDKDLKTLRKSVTNFFGRYASHPPIRHLIHSFIHCFSNHSLVIHLSIYSSSL